MLFCVLLVLSSFLLVNSAVPACNGPVTFNPSNAGTWYPSNFSNSQPPLFPDNFNCEYQINVPQGWYSLIHLTVNMTNFQNVSAPVQVVDQFQNTEEVFSSQQERFFFISGGGKIKLSTGMSKVIFGFNVIWLQYPTISPNITHINANDRHPVYLELLVNQAFQYTADSQVSATIISQIGRNNRQIQRAVLFFDGPSGSSKCLGTGLQLLEAKSQYYSSGNSMTIMFLGVEPRQIYIPILLQDYENTKNISQFESILWWFGNNNRYETVTLDASKGPVAVQTLNLQTIQEEVIMSLEGTGVLDVYLGGVTKNRTNFVTRYYAGNSDNYFPQMFRGQVKTYVLSGGVATLNISGESYRDYSPSKSIGRKGIIVTEDFGESSENQYIFAGIYSPTSDTAFKYSISIADLVPGATLEISSNVGSIGKTWKYNSTHLPSLNVYEEIQGDRFYVEYKSNQKANKGFYMNFELVEASTSSTFSILGIVMCLSFVLFH
ncbi:unnamed protein product [Caenorhabditis brenneri]